MYKLLFVRKNAKISHFSKIYDSKRLLEFNINFQNQIKFDSRPSIHTLLGRKFPPIKNGEKAYTLEMVSLIHYFPLSIVLNIVITIVTWCDVKGVFV